MLLMVGLYTLSEVPASSDTVYTVDLERGYCNYYSGATGSLCKHATSPRDTAVDAEIDALTPEEHQRLENVLRRHRRILCLLAAG